MTANTTFTKTLDWTVANAKTSKTLGYDREQAYHAYLDQYKDETDADRAIWFSHIIASDDCKRFLNGTVFQSFDECVNKYRDHLFDMACSTVYGAEKTRTVHLHYELMFTNDFDVDVPAYLDADGISQYLADHWGEEPIDSQTDMDQLRVDHSDWDWEY